MKKHLIRLICVVFILVLLVSGAYALDPVLEPTNIDLGNGLVFYMTPSRFEERGYPKSGLYRDGELIYTTELDIAAAFWSRLYFSDDAMTFLQLPSNHNGFIRFYERGVLVHSTGVQELLRHGERFLGEPFPHTGIQAWRLGTETNHDRANNRLHITTVENTVVTFDLTTGEILSYYVVENPATWLWSAIFVAAGLFLVAVVGVIVAKKRRKMS